MFASPGRPAHPPSDSIDTAVERFDHLCVGLVDLDPVPLEDLRRQVGGFVFALEGHLESAGSDLPPFLVREHERFATSVEQVRGLLRVVEDDDHGGHRQALGQYGRILAEALRRHRADELVWDAAAGAVGAPGKHN